MLWYAVPTKYAVFTIQRKLPELMQASVEPIIALGTFAVVVTD